MKKSKLFYGLSVLASALVFAGCFNGVDLTDTVEKAANYNATAVVNNTISYTGSVSVTSNLKANRAKNEVVVNITSEFELDEATLTAVSIVELNKVEDAYSTAGNALSFEVVQIETKKDPSGNYVTSIYYNVDLTSYNKNLIGIIVNAETLRDTKKNAVLNLNNNEKAGETTDSFNENLIVEKNANGDAYSEELIHGLKPYAFPIVLNVTVGNKSDATGISGLEVTVDGFSENLKGDYNKTSADKLNTIYKLQTVAPGGNTWSDKALSFVWDDDSNSYIAAVTDLEAGTKYRLVTKEDASTTFTYLGVESPVTYKTTTTYSESYNGTYNVYSINTDTIVSDATYSSAVECNPETIQDDFATVKRTALNANGYGAKFEIEFTLSGLSTGSDIGLAAADDFIITTTENLGYKKVDCEVKVLELNEGGVIKIAVITKTPDAKDKKAVNYLASDLLVWAGAGVKVNKNEVNPLQLNFGMYKDAVKGAASGYVQLN